MNKLFPSFNSLKDALIGFFTNRRNLLKIASAAVCAALLTWSFPAFVSGAIIGALLVWHESLKLDASQPWSQKWRGLILPMACVALGFVYFFTHSALASALIDHAIFALLGIVVFEMAASVIAKK